MDRLTKEQIEQQRDSLKALVAMQAASPDAYESAWSGIDRLCDTALEALDPIIIEDVAEAIAEDRQRQSLSQESVRSEALTTLEELLRKATQTHPIRVPTAVVGEWETQYLPDGDAVRAFERASADFVRANLFVLHSPARVAEGAATCEHCGVPFAYGKPQTHSNGDLYCGNCGKEVAESPAKEQPGEQIAALAGGGSQPVDTSTERDRGRAHAVPSESPILAVPQVAASYVVAMVRRLRDSSVSGDDLYAEAAAMIEKLGQGTFVPFVILDGKRLPDEYGDWRALPRRPTWQMKEAGGEAYLQSRELEGKNAGLTAMEMAEGIYGAMFRTPEVGSPPPPERP